MKHIVTKIGAIFSGLLWLVACSCSIILTHEQPMVVVIPSYNNSQWFQKNLDSVFSQEYENYRVLYVDDCSPDNTGQLVHDYITRNNLWHRTTLIRNKQRIGAMANWYRAIHQCRDEEIVVNLDGDDWLAHSKVLARVNGEYQSGDVWGTYGQYAWYPANRIGHCFELSYDPDLHSIARRASDAVSHLRTFKAWLFKQIKLVDLMHDGIFFPMTADKAMMTPLYEMGATHFKFIPDVLYIYNVQNPINDHSVNNQLQRALAEVIFQKKSYPRLEHAVLKSAQHMPCVRVFIVVDSEQQQEALLSYVQRFVCNRAQQDVVCVAQKNILDALSAASAEYSILIPASVVFTQPFDIRACAQLLEQTGAYGFYVQVDGEQVARCALISDAVGAYQFAFGSGGAKQQYQPFMTLYRTKDLMNILQKNVPTKASADAVGLFFMEPHVQQK